MSRGPTAWLSMGHLPVLLVVVITPIAMTLGVIASQGWDPSVFGAFGEEAVENTALAEELLGRDVVVRPGQGHDGKFFFFQALDPLILNPDGYSVAVDRPRYRAQRMLFPVLAGGFGQLPSEGVLWGMAAVNTLALIVGSCAMVLLLDRRDLSPWWSLCFLFGPGMISEFALGGSGVVALALLIVGIDQLERGATGWSTVALVASVMAREVMLLAVMGVILHGLIRRRRWLGWLALLGPVSIGVWRLYVDVRLRGVPEVETLEVGGAPLSGLVQALRDWTTDPVDLAIGLALLAVCAWLIVRVLRGSDELLTWAAVPFVGLVAVLSAAVLGEFFNFGRAVAPIVPAAAIEAAPFVGSVRRRFLE